MDVFHTYCLSTSTYLALQSAPLLLTPRLIFSLLATGNEARSMTDLETYLSRSLAFALLTLALLCLVLTGTLPLTSGINDAINSAKEDDGNGAIKDPYAFPTLTITTTYHGLSAFYLYTQIAGIRGFTFGFGAGMVASTLLFCMGVWVLLFGSEKGRISKTTGADKRTSNFPFENRESSREKKKESKRKSVSSKLR